jgi:hypothetical protein
MSVLLGNRIQSAYPRTSYRQGSTDATKVDIRQRPTTSLGTHQSQPLNQAALNSLERSTFSASTDARRRPKTASSISTTLTRQTTATQRKLRSDEIDRLLETLDRDREQTFLVQVDCLADYRKLVETLDLRQTPIDFQYLRDLQKQENLIIQKNACRDKRFRSLIDALEPINIDDPNENNDEHEHRRSIVTDYTATGSYY